MVDDSALPRTRAEQLDALAGEVSTCGRCQRLVEWRESVGREKRAAYRDETYWASGVPGFGDPAARLMVVGLAPAAHGANRTGRMFTGDRSGEWLFRALWRAGFANQPESTSINDGLRLNDAWVTAPVRCAPPANKPTTAERDTCRPFLEREFALLADVSVIVALGGFGFAETARFLGLRGARFGHGVELPAPTAGRDITLIGSYHVSQQNTFTGRLTEEMLDTVFARASALLAATEIR